VSESARPDAAGEATRAGAGPHRTFCTYFDSNYLLKGMALYRSLERHVPNFTLHVLCLDGAALETLRTLNLPGLVAIPLEELEAAQPRLLEAKSNRSTVEYYFTCTSSFVLHLRQRAAAGQPITYLDADLWFFAPVEPLFDELRGASVTMVGHRFPSGLEHLADHGIYNVGWLSFADDQNARECLRWWSDRCIEWCYDRVEPGRYADQKYLDEWPRRFAGVHPIEHRGANVAPWNVAASPISRRDGLLYAGEAPLIFYHFAAFKRLAPGLYDPGLTSYGARLTPALRDEIYRPYLAECHGIDERLRRLVPNYAGGWGSKRRPGPLALARLLLSGKLLVSGR